MKRRTMAASLGAVGALGIGLFAATGAAAADRVDDPTRSPTSTCTQDGPLRDRTAAGSRDPQGPAGGGTAAQRGKGGGQGGWQGGGQGAGQRGMAARSGDHTAYPSGAITAEQEEWLVSMVQEEKLAHDLYMAFDEQYDAAPFERIAASETRHMTAIRTLLATYGVADPTIGLAPGEFADTDLAAMYADLLAQGSESLESAMAVGRAVELDDLGELDQAASGVTAQDVAHTYDQLRKAGERHLAAFGG